MKRNLKISIIVIILLVATLVVSTKVQANYQSIYQSSASNYKREYQNKVITNIRNMEAEGQVMGLKETMDGESLLSTTGSNNIDVHMTKNTEYGAMILLSASAEYGKQGSGTARYVINGEGMTTTTGNVYGVYMDDIAGSRSENVAASDAVSSTYSYSTKINPRYVNRYSDTVTEIDGDAILGWHSADKGSIYSYGYRGNRSYGIFTAAGSTDSATYVSRASIVNGLGF